MSDGVNLAKPTPEAEPVSTSGRGRGRRLATLLLTVVAVLVVFAVAGVAAGWIWHRVWTPPLGEALRGAWYPVRGDASDLAADETSIGQQFGATGLFVVVGAVGGLVLGALVALVVRRAELLMLVVVVAGGALAAYLTHVVGMHLSPPDPAVVAGTAPDFTLIPDAMDVGGRSPYVWWSLTALLGAGAVYLLTAPAVAPRVVGPRPVAPVGPGAPGVPVHNVATRQD